MKRELRLTNTIKVFDVKYKLVKAMCNPTGSRYYISRDAEIIIATPNRDNLILRKTKQNNVKITGYKEFRWTDEEGNKRQRRIHRMVGETWMPNPMGHPVLHHLDHNKQNNSVDNLEWTTHSENTQEFYKYKENKNGK